MEIETVPDDNAENGENQPILPSTREAKERLKNLRLELKDLAATHSDEEEANRQLKEDIQNKALEFCRLYFEMKNARQLDQQSEAWMGEFRVDENDFFENYKKDFEEAYKQAKEEADKAIQDRPLDSQKPKPKKEEVKIDNKTQLGFSMSKKGQSPSLEVRGNIAVFQEQLEKYCKENNIPLKVEVDKETKKKTFIVNLPPDQMAKMIEAVQAKCDQTLKTKFPNDSSAGVHPQRRFEPTKHASRWQSAASAPRSQAAPVSSQPQVPPAPQAASSSMPRPGSG